MTNDERVSAFINSLDPGNAPFLEDLYQKAKADGIPVIRRETAAFLKTLVQMVKPESILEVGTAVGFSALLMAAGAPESCRIVTMEDYEKHAVLAKENITRYGYADRISLVFGDALDELDKLEGFFDLVFLDAAKAQYIHFLPKLKKHMKKGSVLVADNILQEGDILESRFAVERRDRTIHKRMREYLYSVTHDPELESCIIPIGDGITLSVRI